MSWNNWEEFLAFREQISHIENFVKDDFKKVCEVSRFSGYWQYRNIDESLMFSDHRSWVYLIVLNDTVVKVGETGQTLGIKAWQGNTVTTLAGSKSRLGRLTTGDGTDHYIRYMLREDMENGHRVSIWAKRCPISKTTITVAGQPTVVSHTIHKDVERAILDYFQLNIGQLPMLNKAHK